MKANAVFPAESVREKGGCAHHWLIETARGKNSKGVCRLCGANKDFDNRGVEFFYDQEQTPLIVENKKPWQGEDDEKEWEVA